MSFSQRKTSSASSSGLLSLTSLTVMFTFTNDSRPTTDRSRQRHARQREELCAGNAGAGYTAGGGIQRGRRKVSTGVGGGGGRINRPLRSQRENKSQKKRPRRWATLPAAILTSSHVALTLAT